MLPNEILLGLVDSMDERSRRNFRETSPRNRDAYDYAVSKTLHDAKFVEDGGYNTAECWECGNSCIYTKGEVVIMHECICPSPPPSPLQHIADAISQAEKHEALIDFFLKQHIAFIQNYDLTYDRLSTLGK